MDTSIATSAKRFRVTVIEWLSHHAIIEAADAQEAEAIARYAWANQGDTNKEFDFGDSDLDGVIVDEF